MTERRRHFLDCWKCVLDYAIAMQGGEGLDHEQLSDLHAALIQYEGRCPVGRV